jgi:hypothetical protein
VGVRPAADQLSSWRIHTGTEKFHVGQVVSGCGWQSGRADIRRGTNERTLHANSITKPGPHAGDLYCVFRDAIPLPAESHRHFGIRLARMLDGVDGGTP